MVDGTEGLKETGLMVVAKPYHWSQHVSTSETDRAQILSWFFRALWVNKIDRCERPDGISREFVIQPNESTSGKRCLEAVCGGFEADSGICGWDDE